MRCQGKGGTFSIPQLSGVGSGSSVSENQHALPKPKPNRESVFSGEHNHNLLLKAFESPNVAYFNVTAFQMVYTSQ